MSEFCIPQVQLGKSEIRVSIMGLGCMGMSEFYGQPGKDQDSVFLLQKSANLGITLYDTSDMYGLGHNETLLAKAFKDIRTKVVISTKFGITRNSSDPSYFGLCGRPDYVKKACEDSLRRLKTDYIDLFFYHRIDPKVPIEDTVGAMSELIKEGKVREIGLSKVSIELLQKAHQVYPITALQSEYSLWSREVEYDILPFCNSQNISFISYSPLGRGYLTGKIHSRNDLSPKDYRLGNPKFTQEELQKNRIYINRLKKVASRHYATPAQVALAWLLHQGTEIFPIPGTKRLDRLTENIGSINIQLSQEDLDLLNIIL